MEIYKQNMTYTKEEQKQHRAELVEALRSGRYKQAQYSLRDGDYFCCLGVACDVSGLGEWDNFQYLNNSIYLPSEVMKYYGFNEKEGLFFAFKNGPKIRKFLSSLNDNSYTFKEIADVIESEPEGMFV